MNWRSQLREGHAAFFPISQSESKQRGIEPEHVNYAWGGCGLSTHGRVVCSFIRKTDLSEILRCVCSCDEHVPCVLINDENGKLMYQTPIAVEFRPSDSWPPELSQLYNEAAKALAAGAHTACAMVCRKILMATSCHAGEIDGKPFVDYVDHITGPF